MVQLLDDPHRPRPEDSKARGAAAVRWAWLTWGVSFGVLALKAAAWFYTQSTALMADATESLLDLGTASLIVFAVRLSQRPPDEGHPFGHGKVEYFSAGFQGALILAAGAYVLVDAVRGGMDARALPNLELGLVLSILATAINLALALSLIRAGGRLRSPALSSDGRHNLADVVTTLGSWLGLGLAWGTGWWILDPLCAVLVAIHILWTGVGVARVAIDGLMDAAWPEEELEEARRRIEAELSPALEYHDLRSRRSGSEAFLSFHLVMHDETPVLAAHALCDRIEAALERAFPGVHTTIHVEPEHERERPQRPEA